MSDCLRFYSCLREINLKVKVFEMTQESLNYISKLFKISLDELKKIDIPERSFIVTSISDVSSSTIEEDPPVTRQWDDYQYEIQSVEYICHHCFCLFSSPEQYRQHELSVHAGINILINEECEIEAENVNPTACIEDPIHNLVTGNSHDINRHNHHRRSKSPKKLTEECPSSKEKFSSKRNLERHKKTHNNENLFYCNVCLYETHNIRNFKKHSNKHRNDGLHICCHCGRSYKIKASLEKHLYYQHDLRVQSIDSQQDIENLVDKKQRDSLKIFSNTESLKLVDAEHKKITYQCDVCLYTTFSLYLLNRHISRHTDNKLHICYYCGVFYKKKASLEKHLNFYRDPKLQSINYHQHPKNLINIKLTCSFCRIQCPDIKSLKQHRETHKKGNTYYCSICLYTTTDLNNYYRHTKKHFNDNVYICYHCGKSFKEKIALQIHLAYNRDPKSQLINDHKAINLRNKMLVCSFCHKNFPDIESLNQHRETHEEENTYYCNICLIKTSCVHFARKNS